MTATSEPAPDWVPQSRPALHHYQIEEGDREWLTIAPVDPPANRVTTTWISADTWVGVEDQR